MLDQDPMRDVGPACMGGWCHYRDRCADHLTGDRRYVMERMCPRGEEVPVPIRDPRRVMSPA